MTCIQSLGQEDPLKKETAIHFSIPAWEIPQLCDYTAIATIISKVA